MKFFPMVVYLMLPSCFLIGQPNEFNPGILKERVAKFSLNGEVPANCHFPFRSIKVIDARADTTKIGFIRRGVNNGFLKLVFKQGFGTEAEEGLNEHYKTCLMPSSQLQLLMVVKRFWADPFPNRQMQQQGNNFRASIFDMYLKVEMYYEREGVYIPFKRIDTLFQAGEGEYVPGCNTGRMKDCEMYGYAVSKIIESVDFSYYEQRIDKAKNKLLRNQLDSFILESYTYPILTDTPIKKGIFLSFSEFRNNTPSITYFKIERDKKAGIKIYDTSSSGNTQILKYWGYCDGKKIYCGNSPYPLSRVGNTFEFFTKKVEYYYTSTYVGTSNYRFYVPYKSSTTTYEPFQLDMETGKIY